MSYINKLPEGLSKDEIQEINDYLADKQAKEQAAKKKVAPGPPIRIDPKPDPTPKTDNYKKESDRDRRVRERAADRARREQILSNIDPNPVPVTNKTQTPKGDIEKAKLQQELGNVDPAINIKKSIPYTIGNLSADYEKMFTRVTDPLREMSASKDLEAQKLASTNPAKGLFRYVEGNIASGAASFIDALTLPVRPVQIVKTTILSTELILNQNNRRGELVDAIKKDPFKFSVNIGAGFAGGKISGDLISAGINKVQTARFEKYFPAEKFTPHDNRLGYPEPIAIENTRRSMSIENALVGAGDDYGSVASLQPPGVFRNRNWYTENVAHAETIGSEFMTVAPRLKISTTYIPGVSNIAGVKNIVGNAAKIRPYPTGSIFGTIGALRSGLNPLKDIAQSSPKQLFNLTTRPPGQIPRQIPRQIPGLKTKPPGQTPYITPGLKLGPPRQLPRPKPRQIPTPIQTNKTYQRPGHIYRPIQTTYTPPIGRQTHPEPKKIYPQPFLAAMGQPATTKTRPIFDLRKRPKTRSTRGLKIGLERRTHKVADPLKYARRLLGARKK